ncbi:MAG: DUF3089 domain-containing protein [Flavobacteriaceae bacterium]|nr:DUF3089 domain-containing protein [Flavobacteriaceae bacterium]MDG2315145.1 DUF3089 domain-containing protein [Flavobacteriaceae bacterium]
MKNRFILILWVVLFNSCATSYRTQQYAKEKAPEAPDYYSERSWAELPSVPSELKTLHLSDSIQPFAADVFFVYPTLLTSRKDKSWNADIYDKSIRSEIIKTSVNFQASAWATAGNLYVPFYRQAHLRVYYDPYTQNGGEEAYELAYQDVKRAFEVYLEKYNQGKPIIIASHSQGTGHCKRLIQEFFDGKPLQSQLVAAYLVGGKVTTDEFTSLQPMTKPNEVGGFVTWNSYKKGKLPKRYDSWFKGAVTSNPITWDDKVTTRFEDHKGVYNGDGKLYPKSLQIEKIDGMIWVSLPKIPKRFWLSFVKDYHFGDINLFWEDIRQNAQLRVATFLKQ